MKQWWRSAAIYQIYPRSFLDTNQDGIGDLQGIIARLDYVAQLGVDVVWISPFYPSPMKDFGYDVVDYKNVDPRFGNLKDFSELVETANQLGLKVMIDLVLSHTSEQHPWFIESRRDRTGEKADWYVWADPKPDGTPPNNWLSIFGGSAWEWDTSRRQFYFHNFLTSQPDLNFHNPAVVEAVMNVAQFWLDLGVHGFRLDTVNWFFCDQRLRDNPVSNGEKLAYVPAASNYNMQAHIYNKSRPEVLPFLESFRTLIDRYDAISLGELTAKNAIAMTQDYTEDSKRLHMVYTFSLLTKELSAAHIQQTIQDVEAHLSSGWVCWAFSNHDVERVVSRWRHPDFSVAHQAKFFLTLLMSLRGAVCLYQGEELGLTEAAIDFDDLQDPYGIRLWPKYKGRDGCRTPMPWQQNALNGGFSASKPWLPLPSEHLDKAVDTQEMQETSVLQFARSLIRWRKSQPALTDGSIHLLESSEHIVAFERRHPEQNILAVFNMHSKAATFECAKYERTLRPIEIGAGLNVTYENGVLRLPGFSTFFAAI